MTAGRVGADVDQLRAAADRLEAGARDLLAVRAQTDAATTQLPWAGPKATAWRARWQSEDGPRLAAAASLLQANADKLRSQAQQQVDASQSGAAALGPISPVVWRPGGAPSGGVDQGAATGPQAELHVTEQGVGGSITDEFQGPDGLAGRWGADFHAGVQEEHDTRPGRTESGLDAGASGRVTFGATGHAEAEAALGDVAARADADALLGARAGGEAAVKVGPDGTSAAVGVDTFAGGEISASGRIEADGIEGSAGVSGWAGVGFKARAGGEVSAERIAAHVELGAAFGLGGSLSFSVAIKPKDVVDSLAKMLPWNW